MADVLTDLDRIGMPDSIFREIAQRAADTIVAERALADDLAEVLAMASPFLALSVQIRHPEIEAVLARYREAR